MKSYLVIGLGRFGSSLACELYKMGHEVLGIDENEEIVQKYADFITHAIVGDAKDEVVLKSIGARNFDCAIVAMADDSQDSILVTLMLKEMGVKEVVCKVQSDLHKKVLKRVGADRVVFPERDMGVRLAMNLASSNIIDFIELSDDFSIIEIMAPRIWAGSSIIEINVRANYGINIIAARDPEHREVTVSPPANYVIKDNDVLVMVGSNEDLTRIQSLQEKDRE